MGWQPYKKVIFANKYELVSHKNELNIKIDAKPAETLTFEN